MKRVICFFIAIMLVLPSIQTYAQGVATLLDESYEGGKILRIYEYADGEQFIKSISLPGYMIDEVEKNDDPQIRLLEAKKQLTAAFYILGHEKRLKELDNEQLKGSEDVQLEFDVSLKQTFREQKLASYDFAATMKEQYEKATDEEKNKMIPQDNPYLYAYADEEETGNVNHNENEDSEKNKNKEAEEKKDIDWVLWITVVVIILILGVLTIFTMRKN